MSESGILPQFTATNGSLALGLKAWIPWATSSLPCTGFPGDEDSGVIRGNPGGHLQYFPHGRRHGNYMFKTLLRRPGCEPLAPKGPRGSLAGPKTRFRWFPPGGLLFQNNQGRGIPSNPGAFGNGVFGVNQKVH